MAKNSKDFLEADDIESYDYESTKENVDKLYSKYRSFKNKADIIMKRYKSPLSLDNLGIYSNSKSDPVGNRVEQADKYTKFIETIEGVFSLNKCDLSKDEMIVYNKYLCQRCSDEDLAEYLCISKGSVYYRKRSCYIKVAKWFDLEVFKD